MGADCSCSVTRRQAGELSMVAELRGTAAEGWGRAAEHLPGTNLTSRTQHIHIQPTHIQRIHQVHGIRSRAQSLSVVTVVHASQRLAHSHLVQLGC